MTTKTTWIATLSDRTFVMLKWTLSALSAAVTLILIQMLDIGGL